MGTIIMLIVIALLTIGVVERHVKTKQLKGYLVIANTTTQESNMALIDVKKKLEEEKVYSGKLKNRLADVENATQILLRTKQNA